MERNYSSQITTALLASILFFSELTAAQVTKCIDARTGTVTYTDGACAASEKSSSIAVRAPPPAPARSGVQESDSRQRSASESEPARLRNPPLDQSAPAQAAAAAQQEGSKGAVGGKADSPECARAKRDLAFAQSIRTGNRSIAAEAATFEADCGMPQGTAAGIISARAMENANVQRPHIPRELPARR